MHLRCSKGSFYGEHPLMRPEAVELHMQNSKVGLPCKGRESMKTAGVGGGGSIAPPAWFMAVAPMLVI